MARRSGPGQSSGRQAFWRRRPQNGWGRADRAGRIKVEADLTVPGYSSIFAIGDTVTVLGPNGKRCEDRRCREAGRQACCGVIRARLAGQTPPSFRYRHAGDLATIGRRASRSFGWIKLRGWVAWWAWGLATSILIGLKNRLFVA
jgi:NADH dehydrogenase